MVAESQDLELDYRGLNPTLPSLAVIWANSLSEINVYLSPFFFNKMEVPGGHKLCDFTSVSLEHCLENSEHLVNLY